MQQGLGTHTSPHVWFTLSRQMQALWRENPLQLNMCSRSGYQSSLIIWHINEKDACHQLYAATAEGACFVLFFNLKSAYSALLALVSIWFMQAESQAKQPNPFFQSFWLKRLGKIHKRGRAEVTGSKGLVSVSSINLPNSPPNQTPPISLLFQRKNITFRKFSHGCD